MAATIVSAPGKVLLAGGYLVLDRSYTGLVVATSSRFFCAVRNKSNGAAPNITVRAGQFPADSSTWQYSVVDGQVTPTEGNNKFVAITLAQVLQYARDTIGSELLMERIGHGLDVVVLADNDFYSQREQVSDMCFLLSNVSSQQHPCQRGTTRCHR